MFNTITLYIYVIIVINIFLSKYVTSIITLSFPDVELIDYIDYNTNTIIYKFIYDLNGNQVMDRSIEIILSSNDMIKPWDVADITCVIISLYNNQSIFIPINMNESFVNIDNQSNKQLELDGIPNNTIKDTTKQQLKLYYSFEPGKYQILFQYNEIQMKQYLFYEEVFLDLQFKYIFQPPTHVYLVKQGFNDNEYIHNLYLGRGSYHHMKFDIRSTKSWNISIGQFCSISNSTLFLSRNKVHRKEFITTYPLHLIKKKSSVIDDEVVSEGSHHVHIGNDVWIGNDVVIINNVTIGDGAIIGSNSVIRENVPAYAIVYGNPANIAKYRFPRTVIEKLLIMAWWDWDDEKILQMSEYQTVEDVIIVWETGMLL